MRPSVLLLLAASLALAGCGGSDPEGGEPPANVAPVAEAGADQAVETGALVTLDGTGSSDADGDALGHAWTFVAVPAGSAAALSAASSAAPTFTADVDGAYVVQLVVADGEVESAPDTVTITATPANVAPVADAGPDQAVAPGVVVALDGSGSADPEGDALSYAWTLVSVPDGSAAALSAAATAAPTFTADVDGAYVVQLVVSDGEAESAPDTVTVTATTANVAPVADAGPDQAVVPGALVTLDGSGSADPDGDALTYAWTLVSRPEGSSASLSGVEGLAAPTFTADLEGAYVLELVVSDGEAASAPDPVIVTAARPNVVPVAAAGVDGGGFVGRPIALDGRASDDADGDPLTFLWTFESRPEGSSATLGGEDPSQPRFVPDLPGTYVVRVVVSDGRAESAPDTATHVVLPTFYDERFEASDGGYVHAGAGDVWEWGPPTGWPIARTGSCWGTNLDGDYVSRANATLTSPPIDLSAHAAGTPLRLIWRQAWSIESVNWDPASLTVRVDGGADRVVWQTEHTDQDWTEMTVDLTFAAGEIVRLEWRLISDSSFERRGLYVDDVMIAPGP